MAARTSLIHLSPAVATDQVTSRPCTVDWTSTGDGSALPPQLSVDMIDPTVTFATNDGDVITVTALGDINLNGSGPGSGPFPVTITPPPPPPPTGVPGPVSVLGVTTV